MDVEKEMRRADSAPKFPFHRIHRMEGKRHRRRHLVMRYFYGGYPRYLSSSAVNKLARVKNRESPYFIVDYFG